MAARLNYDIGNFGIICIWHAVCNKIFLLKPDVITTTLLRTQPIIFRSDSDLIFFLSDSRLNTGMIQNFFGNIIIRYKSVKTRYVPVFLSGRNQI